MNGIERAAKLVDDMEPDVCDVGRWGGVIGAIACSGIAMESDDLIVIGRALETLGGSLKERRDAIFHDLRQRDRPAPRREESTGDPPAGDRSGLTIGDLAALYEACEAARAPLLALVKDGTGVRTVSVFAGGEIERLTERMRTCADELARRSPATDAERHVRFVTRIRWALEREAFGELAALNAENEAVLEAEASTE